MIHRMHGTVVAKREYPDYYALDVSIEWTSIEGMPMGTATVAIKRGDERWEPALHERCTVLIDDKPGNSNEVIPYDKKSSALSIFTIFEGASDFPTKYSARRFIVFNGKTYPTKESMGCDDLEELRNLFIHDGLARIERSPEDDPVILESWI